MGLSKYREKWEKEKSKYLKPKINIGMLQHELKMQDIKSIPRTLLFKLEELLSREDL